MDRKCSKSPPGSTIRNRLIESASRGFHHKRTLGGARPSSGAASPNGVVGLEIPWATKSANIAAPEDGRAPVPVSGCVPHQIETFHCLRTLGVEHRIASPTNLS